MGPEDTETKSERAVRWLFADNFTMSHTHTHTQCSLPVAPNPVGVNCMAFNHNSNLLVTGGADGMLRIYGRMPSQTPVSFLCL